MLQPAIIDSDQIADAVCALYREMNFHLREDVLTLLQAAQAAEESELAREIIGQLLENARLSAEEGLPLCQDTGLAVAFVDLGAEVLVLGRSLREAVDEGVRRAQEAGPLRASVVGDPLERENTGDNTPAVLHIRQVPGDELRIQLMAKGGGAENMSRLYMLSPGEGRDGVVRAAVETVREAGPNACPPVIVGICVGGSYDLAPVEAKRALLRDLRSPHPDSTLAEIEAEILDKVNALGIGPQGLGGRTTALGVMIESRPCHIASLPVAVNLACHSQRHGEVVLTGEQAAGS